MSFWPFTSFPNRLLSNLSVSFCFLSVKLFRLTFFSKEITIVAWITYFVRVSVFLPLSCLSFSKCKLYLTFGNCKCLGARMHVACECMQCERSHLLCAFMCVCFCICDCIGGAYMCAHVPYPYVVHVSLRIRACACASTHAFICLHSSVCLHYALYAYLPALLHWSACLLRVAHFSFMRTLV